MRFWPRLCRKTVPLPKEIDRLDDQFLQLSEQEALLQAQLSVMDTLEDKKAERIRLLGLTNRLT